MKLANNIRNLTLNLTFLLLKLILNLYLGKTSYEKWKGSWDLRNKPIGI